MNHVILTGNLAADPELKTYAGDRTMATFCIAVGEGYGDKKKTYFFNCVASGKTGEAIAKFFTKGQQIIAAGKLYTKQKEGEKWHETCIAINEFNFCGPKKDAAPKTDTADTPADDVPDFPFG